MSKYDAVADYIYTKTAQDSFFDSIRDRWESLSDEDKQLIAGAGVGGLGGAALLGGRRFLSKDRYGRRRKGTVMQALLGALLGATAGAGVPLTHQLLKDQKTRYKEQNPDPKAEAEGGEDSKPQTVGPSRFEKDLVDNVVRPGTPWLGAGAGATTGYLLGQPGRANRMADAMYSPLEHSLRQTADQFVKKHNPVARKFQQLRSGNNLRMTPAQASRFMKDVTSNTSISPGDLAKLRNNASRVLRRGDITLDDIIGGEGISKTPRLNRARASLLRKAPLGTSLLGGLLAYKGTDATMDTLWPRKPN